uniref:Uncharacterized protein n=1 Tax=viral metagenome TaxID=1070528 RepID=A0A6C0AU83_9ZZZZ|tara:strand:+ start:30580 stop:31065 length:486 start_codon:yes stop_codon:yes gene_type:complete
MEEQMNEIIRQAQEDPSLYSTIDIHELLDSLNDDKYDYILNKTAYDIQEEVYTILNENELVNVQNYASKLLSYRYVDDLNELHNGKFIRWIRKSDKKLTNGNILMNVDFTKNGTQLLLKSPTNRFTRIKWDDCIVFQILSQEEQLLLTTNQYIQREENEGS